MSTQILSKAGPVSFKTGLKKDGKRWYALTESHKNKEGKYDKVDIFLFPDQIHLLATAAKKASDSVMEMEVSEAQARLDNYVPKDHKQEAAESQEDVPF